MSGRAPVKSAFANLRPTILREPARSPVSPEAEARLLSVAVPQIASPIVPQIVAQAEPAAPFQPPQAPVPTLSRPEVDNPAVHTGTLLQKKKRERLLLVSFRMPQSLKEKLEQAAKMHEVNQTDLINEAIEMNLKRYI